MSSVPPSIPQTSSIKKEEKIPIQRILSDDGKFELYKYGNEHTRLGVRHKIKLFEIKNNNSMAITFETTLDVKCEELQKIRGRFKEFHKRAKEVWKNEYNINVINFINKLQKELILISIESESKKVDEVDVSLSLFDMSLDDLYRKFQSYLYFEDRDFFDVNQAVVIESKVPGDPLWVYPIDPPGGTKTEILRSYKNLPNVYTLDTLTPNSLVSGLTIEKDGELVPIGGILEELDGKVLVIKDFTTILTMTEIARNEIFGQLRSCYDGYYEKAFGTMKEKISIKSKFGLLAGVTSAIDFYTRAHTILGERFLKIRHNPDKREATLRALKNTDPEIMRKELADLTRNFFSNIKLDNIPEISEEQIMLIEPLASYLAHMRTHILCEFNNGRIVAIKHAEVEVPTRIAKQLKKLAQCLAIVRGKDVITTAELKTLWRVVRDTCDQDRHKIAMEIAKKRKGLSPIVVSELTGLHYNTARNELEKMEYIKILTHNAIKEDKNYIDVYWFSDYFLRIMSGVATVHNMVK